MNENQQIAVKHKLLDCTWGINWKQYDNGYAVAYQNIRKVFDTEILPIIEALQEIESLDNQDFETGESLSKLLPDDYRKQWILKTKLIARRALGL